MIILLLILGSGSMSIQIGAFIIIFINFLRILFFAFKHKYLNNAVTLCFLFLTAAITVSAIMSVIQAVSFAEIVLYNFSMYLFIMLFLSAKTKIIDYKGYMNAALVFSFIVIFLVCAGMFNIFGGRQLQAKALKILSGMDGQKPIAGIIFQGFYLQGTLTLIPACVFFIHQKNYKNFLICFFALALSLSRFGLLTVIFCYCLMNKKKVSRIFLGMSILILVGYIFQFPILISLMQLFSGKDDGMSIRMGHLLGIIEVFEENPIYFFFGQGPGSVFYSYGFNKMTSTVEISQFDFLRKYGVFTTVFFVLIVLFAAICLIYRTDRTGRGLGYGIIAHFIVSISNPVLLSIPFVSYFAICIVYYIENSANISTYKRQASISNSYEGEQK